MNRGAKILLRLRPHQSPDTFYDQDQLVLVMLHEVSLRILLPWEAQADIFGSLRITFMDRTMRASTSCWGKSRKSGTRSNGQDTAVRSPSTPLSHPLRVPELTRT